MKHNPTSIQPYLQSIIQLPNFVLQPHLTTPGCLWCHAKLGLGKTHLRLRCQMVSDVRPKVGCVYLTQNQILIYIYITVLHSIYIYIYIYSICVLRFLRSQPPTISTLQKKDDKNNLVQEASSKSPLPRLKTVKK